MQPTLRSALGSPRNYLQDVLNRTVISPNNPQNSLTDGGESGGGRNAGLRWVAPLMSLFPSSRSWKMRFHSKLSKIEESLSRENHRVLQFSGLFLGLSLYSYHVRELLICWLFFCLVFFSVALAVLGGVLVGYAGKRVTVWACAAARMTPVVALGFGKSRFEEYVRHKKVILSPATANHDRVSKF